VREDATKESDFTLDDDVDDDDEENDWDGEVEWNEDEVEEALEGDVPDESAAYLEFLNKEAQKFGSFADDDDDEMDEESLLETPLDKVEPYGMFKHVFLSKSSLPCFYVNPANDSTGLQQEQPQLYDSLTKVLGPEEQRIIESVFHEADAKAMVAAANAEAAAAAGIPANGQ
jgi:hypothetical protein